MMALEASKAIVIGDARKRRMRRLYVPLEQQTLDRLTDIALDERRHPSHEAGAMLSGLLSGDDRRVLGEVYRVLGRIAERGKLAPRSEERTGAAGPSPGRHENAAGGDPAAQEVR